MSFIGIHNHLGMGSNLKFRDSINKIEDILDYSVSLGHSGMFITEHESIASHLDALEYFESVKDQEKFYNYKLGFGDEIYLCADSCTLENAATNVYPHFILLALDKEGHQAIRELSTIAWTENCFKHVQMRTPTYYHNLEDTLSKYQGHLIGSSACLGSPICRRLLDYKQNRSPEVWKECLDWVYYMKQLFGDNYFFLELQPNPAEEQVWCNTHLIKLAQETNTKYVVSTDSHYTRPEDRDIHKTFLNAEQSDREVDDFYATTYVMSEQEIHNYMDDSLGFEVVEKAINNTMLIYDKMECYDLRKKLHIPYTPLNTEEPSDELYQKYVDKVPLYKDLYESEHDSDRHLLRRLLEYMDSDPYYQRQKAYDAVNECLGYLLESSEVNGVRWSAYLMSMADYIDICWETGSLVGAGRGSGIGFCLLYMLGISQVDPLREDVKTYPWRFLNPKRTSVLDIDTDIVPMYRDKIIDRLKEVYGADRVSKVLTLQTEKSRSAILTAGRGLGLDNDLTSYLASLIKYDRGAARTLKQMYYGDDEHEPDVEFVREMNEHPDLWEAALKIEGLPCGCGSHAGGVLINDEPLTMSTALMRTSSGDIVSQYDLHKCEDVSLIKIDLLATDAVWKIQETLNQLIKAGKIKKEKTLRETYLKNIGVYTLERNDEKMWKMLWDHKVLSFFQMEKQSGTQAIALTHPKSIDDLCSLNSVIRLMPQTPDAEIPLQKYARYHDNISLWYQEMDEAGLTKEEQKILEPILLGGSGICESQEKFMQIVQIPECGGFSLQFADKLRKSVAKKNPKAYLEIEQQYFKETKEKGLSENLCNYVWNTLVATSRGYAFNSAHCLAYSLIGLQELNLCYKYDHGTLYWNTANLIVDSGSGDENSNESTNYEKMSVAISRIQHEGVTVSSPDIQESEFGFRPIEETNSILYGLKGINSINTDLANQIIMNRPYESLEDFSRKMLDTKIIKPSQMMMLIKGGCFDRFNPDRSNVMCEYLKRYSFEPCNSLTLSQLRKIEELDMIPEDIKICVRYLKYKDYVLDEEGWVEDVIIPDKKVPKCGYHDRLFALDHNSQSFFIEHFSEENVARVEGQYYVISEKKFSKEVDKLIQPLRDWMLKKETLREYNDRLFDQLWNEKCQGTEASWAMQSLSYYDKEHELGHVEEEPYGIVNFFDLPEDPEPYEYYMRWINGERKQLPKFKIVRIAGTVLATDKEKSVTILTKYGTVTAKFPQGNFSFYNRRLSSVDKETGKKNVIENSWFKRGTMLIIAGFRRGDNFVPRTYQDTAWKHTVNLIHSVNPDGTLDIQLERTKI